MLSSKRLSRSFKRIDLFATDVTFKENGESSFGSVFGACLSIIIMSIVATYACKKFIILSTHDDTNYNEYKTEGGLSDGEFFQDQL